MISLKSKLAFATKYNITIATLDDIISGKLWPGTAIQIRVRHKEKSVPWIAEFYHIDESTVIDIINNKLFPDENYDLRLPTDEEMKIFFVPVRKGHKAPADEDFVALSQKVLEKVINQGFIKNSIIDHYKSTGRL